MAYDADEDYFYIDEFGVGRHFFIDNGGNVGIGEPPSSAGLSVSHPDQAIFAAFFTQGAIGVEAVKFGQDGGTGVRGDVGTQGSPVDDPPNDDAVGVLGIARVLLSDSGHPTFPEVNPNAYGVRGELEQQFNDFNDDFPSAKWAGVFGSIYPYDFETLQGYGVYSEGPTGATGTKSFQIDHPLDPENKMLNHYCSEGPEPLNVYSGTIVTDANGTAWVQLPDYFEAINRDPRYQLTVIGTFAQAIIGQEIGASGAANGAGNRFSIRTSEPNVKVSWEVKAVRNDLFVQRQGAPVEVMKSPNDRGKYLSPHLYGLPREMSIFHHPRPDKAPAAGAAAKADN